MSERLTRIGYFLAALLHRCVAFLIRSTGRLAGRLLAIFPWSCKLGFLCVILGGIAFHLGTLGENYYIRSAKLVRVQVEALEAAGIISSFRVLAALATGAGLLLMALSLLAFIKRNIIHLLLKIAGAAFVVIWLWTLAFLVRAPQALFLAEEKLIEKDLRNFLWVTTVWAWFPFLVLALLFLACLCLRSARNFYTRRDAEGNLAGDVVLENVRTHGEDPDFRLSTYWATFVHIFVLFIIPILLRGGCWQAPYGIPKGSGNPVVRMIKVKKIKKKPKEQFVFNPNSAISYYRPDIDDSKIMEIVEDETLDTYVATRLTGLGKGGGKRRGWPNGMENARVRFIRLEYAGGDWDQDMGKGADYNFLIRFREMTGFQIAAATEAIGIADLKWFPKHRAPPFVYLTGKGNISVSTREVRILRWYLLEEGGMIFADNGGGNFNSAFRGLIRRIFPDKYWVDVANDDIIYKQPYYFPNGAPPLWHHSGTRGLGIRHEGRWLVFYHQGDINDAWKTGGSGASKSLQSQAFKMGVNVVNYAFNQYMAIHFGD